jgi:hypothetical protein
MVKKEDFSRRVQVKNFHLLPEGCHQTKESFLLLELKKISGSLRLVGLLAMSSERLFVGQVESFL